MSKLFSKSKPKNVLKAIGDLTDVIVSEKTVEEEQSLKTKIKLPLKTILYKRGEKGLVKSFKK